MLKRTMSALSAGCPGGLLDTADEVSCPHDEAGLRLNEMREIEVCAECGIEIEGVTESNAEVSV